MPRALAFVGLGLVLSVAASNVIAQDDSSSSRPPLRSSLVEDRAARRLLEAGDTRYEAEEQKKALEIWQSVIERYPRSKVRFQAHSRLGDHFLDRERAYDKARAQFEVVASEDNPDDDARAAASLKVGVCFYEARNYGKCFQVMRDVIQQFPISRHVNQAYYYIGLGHFQLGHYSRAIAALEKVGTALSENDQRLDRIEAGKRFFVKIEDADLAALEPGAPVEVQCRSASGDVETVACYSLGRNVRIVLGSIPTQLGKPQTGNGVLEVKGDDEVQVTYVDAHTADKQFDQPVERQVSIVGQAVVSIRDGAFEDTLKGVVLGKSVNLQVADADRDLSDGADELTALVEVYRKKTQEEIEAETIEALKDADGEPAADGEKPEIDPLKKVDSVEVRLTEADVEQKIAVEPSDVPGAAGDRDASETKEPKPDEADLGTSEPAPQDEQDDSVHSGVFRGTVPLANAGESDPGDDLLQARPGDVVRLVYLDERNLTEGVRQATFEAQAIEGNLGGVRVTRAVISDTELRVRTRLKTADALTRIGNRYKDFGLQDNADQKYEQALAVAEDVADDATRLGGRLLEETYVQLWRIYFAMDRLELAAAMAQRLQREFPNSGFVDDALLQLADVAREQGNLQRAIGIYNRLVDMEASQLRGEAQFGIGQCYEQMAEQAGGGASAQLRDRAFQEYKKVFEQFPESGRVGDAVARMADHYYRQRDYARAVDTFETVLASYPDAKFLDVILFNYGRCLYRMDRKAEARRRFDQLIGEYPESPLAGDAKKISDALAQAGN